MIRLTRFGAVVIGIALVSVLLPAFGSGTAQAVGFSVAILVGLLLAGEGLSGTGGRMAAQRKAEVARERAAARPRARPADPAAELSESTDELWARARARRRTP